MNQLVDSALSLMTAIKTILEDTPQVHSVEVARAAIIAVKAQTTPMAPQLPSVGARSAATAITGYADPDDDQGENPKRHYRKKQVKKFDKVATTACQKRVTLLALKHLGVPASHKDLLDQINARPSVYVMDGNIPKLGLGPTIRALMKEGLVTKTGDRNWSKYELSSTE